MCLITSTNQNWKRCNSRGDNWFFRSREKLTEHSFALRAKHSKTNYPSLSHEEVSDGTSASGCLYKVGVRASKNGFGVFVRPLLHSQRAAVRDWYARSIQLYMYYIIYEKYKSLSNITKAYLRNTDLQKKDLYDTHCHARPSPCFFTPLSSHASFFASAVACHVGVLRARTTAH